MQHRRTAAAAVVVALVVSACSSSVVVSNPQVAEGGGEATVGGTDATDTGGDGDDGETILAPDFELELEPGQDPEEILGTDGGPADGEASEDADALEAPDDAIFGLCPAIEAVTARTSAWDLDALLAEAPAELHTAIRTLAVDPTGAAVADPAPLDAWSTAACSVPLVAAARQLSAACPGSGDAAAACVRSTVDQLGGLCFDEDDVLLSCVSGLPAQ